VSASVLVDTNAYTALLRGNAQVLDAVASAELVYVSTVVVGELLAGFRGGTRQALNEDRLHSFLEKNSVRVLDVTLDTADCFGRIWQSLRTAGTPMPLNDVWIAAHAIETGSILLTFDGHFSRVPGLRLWER
jgi:tRNA(fMet)-specific endonuclease VapC